MVLNVDVALTIAGPFSGDDGMAEFARQLRAEIDAGDLAARFVDVDVAALAARRPVDVTPLLEAPGPVLFLLQPPELVPLARHLGHAFFSDRLTIGWWWWEAPRLPADWLRAARLLDEVWTATEYIRGHVAAALGNATKCPLPPAALEPHPRPLAPGKMTRFLVTFDYRGTVERKNPDGALRAYLRAFPEPREGVSLTIKTQAADRIPFESRRLHRLARGRPDITFIDRRLSRAELDALHAAATCYVSLHRAEGLGLGMLEAMRAGRPVIATGFSGNLEFMPTGYPLLVDWRWTEIRKGTPLFGPLGGEWAEPDIDHATRLMLEVVNQPTLSRQAIAMGLNHLTALAASSRPASFMRERLAQLEHIAHARPAPDDPIWTTDAKARTRAVLATLEPRLRRVPWLHKFAMDLFFGRFDPRARRPPQGSRNRT